MSITLSKVLQRVIKINTLYEHKNQIVYVDDINKFVIRQRHFGTLEHLHVYIDDQTEDFPYSHHIH